MKLLITRKSFLKKLNVEQSVAVTVVAASDAVVSDERFEGSEPPCSSTMNINVMIPPHKFSHYNIKRVSVRHNLD